VSGFVGLARVPGLRRRVAQRYCSKPCSGRGHRRLGEDEVMRLAITTARRCGVEWSVIAAELAVSVATIQRTARRANAQVVLPAWIRREQTGSHHEQ
jgi:hypothetical protein